MCVDIGPRMAEDYAKAEDSWSALGKFGGHMIPVLTAFAAILALLLYVAWLNRLLARCPHCGKIGSRRYDRPEPPVEHRDEDGFIVSHARVYVCRRCGKRCVDKWSDQNGRSFEKADDP